MWYYVKWFPLIDIGYRIKKQIELSMEEQLEQSYRTYCDNKRI